MDKFLSMLVVGILIIAAIGAIANAKNNKTNEIVEEIAFSPPLLEEKDKHVFINVKNANSVLTEPGKPILPVYTKTFVFPFGTKIKDVKCFTSKVIKHEILSKEIISASEPLYPASVKKISIKATERNRYDSNESIFPKDWFSYWSGCGLQGNKHVLFLTIQFCPVRYSYIENRLYYVTAAEIRISYQKPSDYTVFSKDTYDLLIITPNTFLDELQPLVEHKENHGVHTILVTPEEIYEGKYFPVNGRDDAEKIKYFIKNALEEWGIKYVLLVGGRKPGLKEEWLLPVRYVHVAWPESGKHLETRYVSDLYFADIYDASYNFSTWDTDENNVFSEWGKFDPSLKDDVDLYPDVYLGRLACRNKLEVKIMVEKIITYENSLHSKKVVLAGGDNFEEGEEIEGEVVAEKTLASLPGFEPARVYASQMDVTPRNIRNALGNGAMFMHLHGHGSPVTWGTHKPGEFDKWEKGLQVWNIPMFFNNEYPIVAIGGCHTAMFNISVADHPWTPIPSPEGLGWWFARKYKGGGIATVGYTCFPVAFVGNSGDLDGNGVDEPDCVESGYGYMEVNLFAGYGLENLQHLGDCWGYTISKYVEHFKSPYKRYHLHTIQGFVLLGDPSLKIGGY
jgi:hypothetical protein